MLALPAKSSMAEHPTPSPAAAFGDGLDKARIRKHFDAAVRRYDAAAVLQRTVADRLIARLDVVRAQPQDILDAGCGTGYCTRLMARRYRRARVIGVDLVWRMVVEARRQAGWFARARFVGADAEQLPFGAATFDLVLSNFMLPWCDPARVFAECLRVLRPDGLLVFTSLGPDTLQELRAAWLRVDPDAQPHLFLDMHDVGDALIRAGFVEPVMDVERYTLTYPDVRALLRDLKALGAGNARSPRRKGLASRSRFERFRAEYATQAHAGRLPATCEVVFGHAWAPRALPGDRRVIRIKGE
jgi:malonyl-CoA O-methyltransferase